MPRRNGKHFIRTPERDGLEHGLGGPVADLAVLVVSGCPDLAVHQKERVLLAADDHLHVFVSKHFELDRLGHAVNLLVEAKLAVAAIAAAEHPHVLRQEEGMLAACADLSDTFDLNLLRGALAVG